MNVPKMPELPTEMIEAILDNLHDDNKSLNACSLVCKDWMLFTRRRQFSRWTLDLRHPAGDIDELLNGPGVLPFLRQFCIRHHGGWDRDLPLLVGRQNHIQVLHLFATPAFPMLDIYAPSMSFRNFSSVSTLRLERIAFTDTSALLELVCDCPRLQTLSITRSTIRHYVPVFKTFQPSPYLVALELDTLMMDEILGWFLELAALPSFLSVCLHNIRYSNLDLRRQFITTLNKTVEHLSLPIYGPSSPSFDLSHLTQLRSIEFSFEDLTFVNSLPVYLSYLRSPRLEIVAFHLEYRELPVNGTQAKWEEVDALLQRPPFNGLKEVYFDAKEPTALITDYMLCCLRQCHARGILRIHERIRPRFYGMGVGGLSQTFGCGFDVWDHP